MTVRFGDLDGAAVVITGGGSGIGAALTEGFLRQGARVAFLQRSDATAFCARMADVTGARPAFLPCDITDLAALRSAIAHAAALHGPAQVLVNNAANDARHSTLEVDEAFWEQNLAINLKAYFFAAQTVLPAMQKARAGRIVNISSISYMMGNAGYPAYTAANGAITALTRSLAREFGPDGIRVNALAPGWVLTKRQLDLWATPKALAEHLARQCLPRHLAPADIVDPVLFLASQASSMVTGQLLAVDGGVVSTG